MVTAEQIKAARALLKWKQTTLAEKAGLSLPSINNVERGIGSPRLDTMRAIQSALENAGIQFMGSSGVCLPDEIFEVHKYEGADFVKKQNDDLFSCMRGPEDEVLQCGLDDRKFVEYAPDQVTRYDRHHRDTNFSQRILIRRNDMFFLAPPVHYRWISEEMIGTIPYLVYKDRFVMLMWEARRTVIIRNQSIADTFRKQFEFLWNLADEVPKNSVNRLDDPVFVAKLDK